ncbi:glycosyltransferase family 90 protein [Gonapodya prolifera JEL478]|uniref:Glycosyltransferase family 90 protein n=1 Tax=Gonapodya prolifera (strain JEL478) TaxID=1344416 RepID=A0A139AR85_GONPJ|nr:glycosyltransferase family 90 protein [Gonapodya prolifera JEL478]|eukprot:KXS19239.1 glycosyltransferase family 90 protein [Gonapodya prolifera JEL478]
MVFSQLRQWRHILPTIAIVSLLTLVAVTYFQGSDCVANCDKPPLKTGGREDQRAPGRDYKWDPAFEISPSAPAVALKEESEPTRRPAPSEVEDPALNLDGFELDVEPVPYIHQDVPFPSPQQSPPTLDEAIAYYTRTQGKRPFRLYKQWYNFAVSKKCNILGAAHLSKSLQHLPKEITSEMVEQASKLPRTGTLYIAPLNPEEDPHKAYHDDSWSDQSTGEPLESPNYVVQNTNHPGAADTNWQSWMGPFAIHFPRYFRMVLNMEDWPRIFIPGKDCRVKPTAGGSTHPKKSPWLSRVPVFGDLPGLVEDNSLKQLAAKDMHNPFNLTLPAEHRHNHGFFFPDPLPGNHYPIPIPIFSQATIPDCYADILVPLGYAVKTSSDQISPEKRTGADVPFINKPPVAVWRGTTTGAEPIPSNVSEWNRMHRHRLVKYSKNLRTKCDHSNDGCFIGIDAKFTGYLQMFTDFAYQEHVRVFGDPGQNHMPYELQFYHRFLLDVDGNSFSQRFHTFLRESKSLILRARGFVDWSDHWVVPYVHYIPLRFDWSDLVSAVQWAISNVTEAKKIAEQGHDMGRRGLRYEDIQCHMFAVMGEYEDRLAARGNLPPVG